MIAKTRAFHPLIHHLTNSVTINDCANITLAMGGSPMMAEYFDEQEEFASIGHALVLNTGTINQQTSKVMQKALACYCAQNKPVVLDPIALGISKARDRLNFALLESDGLSIIKGNASEISQVIGQGGKARGTDSTEIVDEAFVERAREYASQTRRVLAITGPIDWVISEHQVAKIFNGSVAATKITGAGCMCASLCGVFVGACHDAFQSALYALVSFGIASELSARQSTHTGSFKTHLLDCISLLDDQRFHEHQRYEIL